jgi:large subunit ribosomal protein L17
MFRNMATSLIEEERIQTTAAKAKELRPIIERLITLGKRNAPSVVAQATSDGERAKLTAARVAAVRQAGKTVRNRNALQKLFGDIAERFVDRQGGYTRVLRVGRRLGDNAELAIIELLPEGYQKPAKAGRSAPVAAPENVTEAAEAAEEVVEAAAVDEGAAEAAEQAAEAAVEATEEATEVAEATEEATEVAEAAEEAAEVAESTEEKKDGE